MNEQASKTVSSPATGSDDTAEIAALLRSLPELVALHRRDSETYAYLAGRARTILRALFASPAGPERSFGPFGGLSFPYHSMGAIDSLDLFGLDELIILAFYWANRNRYRRVADLGANLGLHTICLARCGYQVQCYEPDPETFASLVANLERNGAVQVDPHRAAVSVDEGEAEFVRVHGNRTGSHLAGAKANPYGDLERFKVKLEAFTPIAAWADLLKVDVEGHEAVLIGSTDRALWDGVDAILEVGNPENAERIYTHLSGLGVNMFSQKNGWGSVETLVDVPTSHRDGSLFVTTKPAMPWSEGAC